MNLTKITHNNQVEVQVVKELRELICLQINGREVFIMINCGFKVFVNCPICLIRFSLL